MKKLILPIACLVLMGAAPAKAQVRVHVDIGLPVAPPLVVVQPGIQVVEGFNDEVFFHAGWYWCRRSDGWFRARHPRDHFYPVPVRRVPRPIREVPPGHYRNWHRDSPKHFEKERRREIRQERKEERRERRDERHDQHGRGHDRDDRDDRGRRGH